MCCWILIAFSTISGSVILIATKWVDLSSSGIGLNWLASIGRIEISGSSDSESESEASVLSSSLPESLAPSLSSNLALLNLKVNIEGEVSFEICSVTRMWEISQLWHNLKVLDKFCKAYLVIGHFWSYFGKNVMLLGKFSLLLMAKYFKII